MDHRTNATLMIMVMAFVCSPVRNICAFESPGIENESNIERRQLWGVVNNFVEPRFPNEQGENTQVTLEEPKAKVSKADDPDEDPSPDVVLGSPEIGIPETVRRKLKDMFKQNINRSLTPEMKCHEVRNERFRCCRVYDHVVEAWWCPARRPFCCHQGTSCAVCCTIDELRQLDAETSTSSGGSPGGCPPLSAPKRPQLPSAPVDDESWFWNGMKAAWLTMVGVLLASLCCTCIAHKCITYLVKIVNEDDPELDDEYLAYHFDQLTLVGDDTPSSAERQAALRRQARLPPKYSDIDFTPAQPEGTTSAPEPNEPPPVYTSDLESEAVEARTLPHVPATNQT